MTLILLAGTVLLSWRSDLVAQNAGAGGVMVQGIVDGEGWATSGTSNLLTRNGGRPAGLGRLQLWGAYEPLPGLVAYAQGEFEGGSASQESASSSNANQYGLRYTVSPALVIDAGRFFPIIGTFPARHFSTRNPLIGEPDGYSADYPLGVKVSGDIARFDYRAAMVSLPASHVDYVPAPTPRLRPAVGAGVTPFVGFRVGGSFTTGPYLNDSYTSAQLSGETWTYYEQRVGALDLEFSRGYFELHAEGARGSYDVPGQADVTGFTYYVEPKYTFTPRFYLAARVERNDYPFIRASATGWTGRLTDLADGEFGGGYRVSATTLVKLTVRADRWWAHPPSGTIVQGGRAVAIQVSQAFDAIDWFDRDR
jgi:hypothetical protein